MVLGFVVGVVLGLVIDEALAQIESLPRYTVLERYYDRYRSSKLPERYWERYRSSKRARARARQPLDEAPVRDSSDFDEPGTALRRGYRPDYPAGG